MEIKPFVRKVHFYETDAMGVVHHSNYIRWFEEARIDLLEQANYPYEKIAEQGIHFMIIDVSCEYKNMVRFGDEVQIFITAKFDGPIKMLHEYKIMKGEQLCISGKTTSCAFHAERKKIVSPKKALSDFYKIFASKE